MWHKILRPGFGLQLHRVVRRSKQFAIVDRIARKSQTDLLNPRMAVEKEKVFARNGKFHAGSAVIVILLTFHGAENGTLTTTAALQNYIGVSVDVRLHVEANFITRFKRLFLSDMRCYAGAV